MLLWKMEALMDDPRVIEAYKTSARVQARNFANARLEAGEEVASVAQGEEMWANTTIEEISTNTAALLKDKKKKAEVMKVSADLWKAYNEKYNIGADTPDGKRGEDFTSRYLAIRQEIEQGEDIVNNAVSAQGTRDKDLMNKAFMMNMQYNINDDMMAAAKSYSMIDYKESIILYDLAAAIISSLILYCIFIMNAVIRSFISCALLQHCLICIAKYLLVKSSPLLPSEHQCCIFHYKLSKDQLMPQPFLLSFSNAAVLVLYLPL